MLLLMYCAKLYLGFKKYVSILTFSSFDKAINETGAVIRGVAYTSVSAFSAQNELIY